MPSHREARLRLSSIAQTVAFSLILVTALLALQGRAQQQATSAPKPPRPQQLDKDIEYVRDPETGELRAVPKRSASSAAPAPAGPPGGGFAIRSRVSLVEISCSAIAATGEPLRNLTREDFQLSADGAPHPVSHFDSSTEPAHIALVLDASPSEFHSLDEMKSAARAFTSELSPRDEVAVVAFAGHPHQLLPFSTDRKQLETALGRIQLLRAVEETGSNIYGSVYLTARRLFTGPHAPTGRKAIVLLTDGQDSGLSLNWNPASMFPPKNEKANYLTFEDVVRELATVGIEIFVISTENRPKGVTDAWLAAHSKATLISDATHAMEIPTYTVFLAEFVRRVGGQLYFLREIGSLSDVYRRIAIALRTEYTLGFYPSAAASARGWHSVDVQFAGPKAQAGARLDCRPSYYIPASQ
ncbi:MAG TPA: VWA domain-containing protein [Candidatus Acidoferrum sp.]|nr:VWA domain-containing protein [Candidatus Acidoferrum sp.]